MYMKKILNSNYFVHLKLKNNKPVSVQYYYTSC